MRTHAPSMNIEGFVLHRHLRYFLMVVEFSWAKRATVFMGITLRHPRCYNCSNFHRLEIKYYDAPVIDTHFSKATALSDAKVTSSRKHFATVTRLKSTTPLANMVIDDNSQSSLRHSQLSQSVDTHQSTVQWINQIVGYHPSMEYFIWWMY